MSFFWLVSKKSIPKCSSPCKEQCARANVQVWKAESQRVSNLNPSGSPSIPTKPPLKSANLLSERICGLWGKLLRAFCSIFSVDIFLGSKYDYAFEYPLETMKILLVVLTFKHINDDDDDWKWWWQWLTMMMTMSRVHWWLVLGTKKSLSWHNEVREVGVKRQLQHSHSHNHHSALPDLMF